MAHKRVVFNNKAIKFGNKLVVIEAETPPSYIITATAKSGSMVYDGSAHSVSGLVTNTFTLDGETYTLSGLTTSNPSRTTVGSSANTISGTPVVKDSSNNVVTNRFTVNTVNGTLTITARPVTVSVANKTAEYTGSRISGNTTLNWNGIVSGHTATITYTAASGTNVGSYTGSFGTNFQVMSGNTNVTANYDLGTKTPGTLTITRIPDRSIPMNTSNWTLKTEGGSDGSKSAIFSNGVLQLKSSGGASNDYWQANCAYAYTALIDFSKYSTLTINYTKLISAQHGTWSTAKVGLLNATDFVVYNNNRCTEQSGNNWLWSQSYTTNGADQKGTINYDISSVTGTARIFLVCYSYQSTGAQLFADAVTLKA